MSSSRSDVVTQFVRSSVRPFVRSFVPFFFFSVLGVLSSPKEFQWCFKKVLRVFEVSRMFQVSFKGVYRKFQGCFQKVSRVFQGSFKSVSRKFQERFKEFSVCIK